MTDTLLGIVIVAVLALAFGWITLRALRGGNRWVKWIGGLAAALITLILVALTALSALGTYRLFSTHTVSVPEVQAPSTPEQVARGEHVATVLCAGCHAENRALPLTGGENMSADAGIPLGDVYAPNLTPGSDIKDWTDTDLFRAIRTGVDDEGRATAMTSVTGPRALSDEDTLAVIAYLRQSPAVEHETPAFKPSLLMALLVGAGLVPSDVPAAVVPIQAPPRGATVEYGNYVAAFMDCRGCHGPKLDGNAGPPFPPSPNLRADFTSWSADEFINQVRAHAAAPKEGDAMPWKDIANLDDVELRALYAYLHDQLSK